ncbi:PREDICTED: 60S ribosomal protein L28-like [Priapulus caudatus]|uniref:Large ribosomal subunit protein eL28 n=1 Tax=Priapulus caudatus TaxID=37621 RepID=A0ABM1ELU9_PRICU|nr:PREDICTED: 60S ribosomal protein L28-like [Priapulus caudatus]
MSADLQWAIIRNNSCFLVKSRNVFKGFTKEPNNLKGINSFRYNGLVHQKTIGLEPAADGKGVVLVTKKRSGRSKPAQAFNRVTLKRGGRQTITGIRKFIVKNKYRKDLKKVAVRRASAILRSQRPVVARKAPRKPPTKQ